MIVYADVVILENLTINYIILYFTSKWSKENARHINIFISSLVGSLYTLASYSETIKRYNNIIVKIFISIIMISICFRTLKVKSIIKILVNFYIISYMLAGIILSLFSLSGSEKITTINMKSIDLELIILIIKGVMIGGILIYIIVLFRKREKQNKFFTNIKIYIFDKKIEIKALIDSGNLLKDPITGNPVIIVEKEVLGKILEKEFLDNTEKILRGDLNDISEKVKKEYFKKIKIIPYSSLGNKNGYLLGIQSDKIEIILEEQNIRKENIIIGIYEMKLMKGEKYKAIIGIELLS